MRKGPVAGISWLQLVAGALAAMTSAWVASYLGVAGTIIGAAVGSLVASVASALYVRGLDRGTTLITEGGSVVSRARPARHGEVQDDEAAEESEVVVSLDGEVQTADEAARAFPWKRVLTWTGITLAAALVAIGAYELVTNSSFGRSDNPSITRPFSQTGNRVPDRQQDAPTKTEPTTEAPSVYPTGPEVTVPPTTAPPPTGEPAPAPEPAPTPEPTEVPTTPAPLVEGE